MKKRGIMAEETDIDTGMDGIDGVKKEEKRWLLKDYLQDFKILQEK